jgi:hypothetical protein
LLGVAPRARILAIHAFSPDAQHPQQATTQNIVAGIDWAIAKGARIINMSFAGPYDPLLQLALKKARDKGVVLIAAAGNMGPQSPPLYPAADENVIAVTAVDESDKLMPQANQGAHVALAAPGVNVLEAAPRASYNFTTGTSVAAAHVSGVAALILERNPGIDPATLEEVLFSTARAGHAARTQDRRGFAGRQADHQRDRAAGRSGRNGARRSACRHREEAPSLRSGCRGQGLAGIRDAGLHRGLRRRGAPCLPQAGGGTKSSWPGAPGFHEPLPAGVVDPSQPATVVPTRSGRVN